MVSVTATISQAETYKFGPIKNTLLQEYFL
jgi:hypothetical protein